MKLFLVATCLLLEIFATTQAYLAPTCTITTYNADDIKDAGRNCAEIILKGITVPAGETLTVNLKEGARLTFEDTITWEFFEWNGPLMNVTGTDVQIIGAPGHVLDARGSLWWDDRGEAGGKIKPLFFAAHGLRNGLLQDLHVRNTPYHAIWIEDSEGVLAQNIYIDSKDGDRLGGHNTDGFNVWRSNNVTIRNIRVYNQDDCVTVKSGTNVLITDNFCSGSHGLSIGSVGGWDYNIVANVTIANSTVVDSDNGVRIKTRYGATGSVTNVTFENIIIKDIHKYGVIVNGDYGSHDGIATGGVPIKHFTMRNITGTVQKSGVNVYILVKNATDWHWSDIHVTGGEQKKQCDGIPEDSGIECS